MIKKTKRKSKEKRRRSNKNKDIVLLWKEEVMTSFKTMTKKMKRKIILNLNHLMMSKTVKVLNNNKEERRKKLKKRT